MWFIFALGWVLGSISLYIYLYATAREAPRQECVECNLSECTDCPYRNQAEEKVAA